VSSGGERGLLSVAFHPDYANNGRLFVNYTDLEGHTHVAEARIPGGIGIDMALSDVMVIEQPYANHNGGQLQFGPDGMLYIGMGDGGSGGDPQNRSQNLGEHLGKLLRIDVDNPTGGRNYGIPADNPFVATGGAKPEIYATGLRNPWRFSFDRQNGDLWIGDVGQSTVEEIDYTPRGQARGANFGWDVLEGTRPFEATPQAPGRLIMPVLEYGRSEGASITGGYVYRGNEFPALKGYYLYADITKNTVRAMKVDGAEVVDRRESPGGRSYVVSFGEGPDGEMYAVTLSGELTKVVATGGAAAAVSSEPVTPRPPVANVVNVGVTDGTMRFDKAEYRVKAGTVTLRMKNTDSSGAPHNIGMRDGRRFDMSDFAMQGETVEFTKRLEPGTYTIICAPHEGMGMTARLVVEP